MNKKKAIYIIIVCVTLGACLWAFLASSIITHKFKKEIFTQTATQQKLNVKNLVVIETKENKKFWEMLAEGGYYNGTNQEAVLHNILGNFFDNDEVVTSFKAQKATFNEKTKRINLNEGAVIIYKDGTYINADEFVWEGTSNLITAKGNVKIVKPNEAVVKGDEAILSNELTDFKIIGRTQTELYGEGKIR